MFNKATKASNVRSWHVNGNPFVKKMVQVSCYQMQMYLQMLCGSSNLGESGLVYGCYKLLDEAAHEYNKHRKR